MIKIHKKHFWVSKNWFRKIIATKSQFYRFFNNVMCASKKFRVFSHRSTYISFSLLWETLKSSDVIFFTSSSLNNYFYNIFSHKKNPLVSCTQLLIYSALSLYPLPCNQHIFYAAAATARVLTWLFPIKCISLFPQCRSQKNNK